MATADAIDIDSLLAPIAEGRPAGDDPRDDLSATSMYRRIKDARNAARAAERGAVAEEDGTVDAPPADWKPVLQLAPPLLLHQSKDLEIAAWLTEALVRVEGFQGLRDGFKLMRGFVENYWDDLFPKPDDDGMESRIFPLTGLNGEGGNGTLIIPLINVPITQGREFGPYAYSHLTQALSLERIADPEKKQKRIEAGAVTRDKFDRSVRETNPDFFRHNLELIEQCREEFQALTKLLDEKCGRDAPPSSSIREAIEQIRDAIKSFLPPEIPSTDSDNSTSPDQTGVAPKPAGSVTVEGLRNREEAFEVLLKVADFFRRTEPHTPVYYALEQAVRWGRLPLPQLLSELIGDNSTREAVFKQLGITLPSDTSR